MRIRLAIHSCPWLQHSDHLAIESYFLVTGALYCTNFFQ